MHKNARSDMTGLSILRYFVSSSCGAARPCASVVPGWESSAIARGGGQRQERIPPQNAQDCTTAHRRWRAPSWLLTNRNDYAYRCRKFVFSAANPTAALTNGYNGALRENPGGRQAPPPIRLAPG